MFCLYFLAILFHYGKADDEAVVFGNDSTDAAKIVEKYVLAADFDSLPVAQIQHNQGSDLQINLTHSNRSDLDGNPDKLASRIVNDHTSPTRSDPNYTALQIQPNVENWSIYPPSGNMANDREVAKTPNYSSLEVSQRSILAVGFITFLILLNSLQYSIMSMAAMRSPQMSPTLLGGVTQALGRRR